VEVFVYQDNEQLMATIETPFCEVGEFAVMTCVQSLPSGAFVDLGIIKETRDNRFETDDKRR